MEIAGKVALVTGAGSGIGRAAALALAAEGAALVVADIDHLGGEETVALIRSRGGKATFVRADVSTPEGIEAMFAATDAAYGGVDIVFNNAGIMSGEPDWPDTPLAKINQVVSINTTGVMMGTRAAVQAMRKRGGGVVINTASISALTPSPNDPVYGGTKAAVTMFTQSCAKLKETEHVRVNAVLPGMTRTAIQAKTGDGTRPAAWLVPSMERIADRILPPEAIASAVLDMIRDDSLAGECRVVTNEPLPTEA
jgi:NAD(P)-dependent dehydrogenase (short-subunit alcohol dehydrogenase family)